MLTILSRFSRIHRIYFLPFLMGIALLGNTPLSAQAQQPFVTDNADVTPRRKFHLEFSNQFDILQRSAFPNLRQNTADIELDYGLFDNLEIGIESPVISLFNSRETMPRIAAGFGDTNLSIKYNFYKEQKDSWLPAMTVNLNIEFPTGDSTRQLGSGLTDYYLNSVMQKSLTDKTTFRLNGGLLFTGNQTTGVLGIKTRGRVFTGGSSLVRTFTDKLTLGVEIAGAVTSNFQLSRGQLQTQIGGNYSIRKNCTIDFGLTAGRFAASPRIGGQIGFSIDF